METIRGRGISTVLALVALVTIGVVNSPPAAAAVPEVSWQSPAQGSKVQGVLADINGWFG
jgi:hypothetical protein